MQSALVPNYPLVPIPSTVGSVVSSSSCSCFNNKKTKHFSRRPHVQLYCSSSGNKVDFDSEALLPQNDDDLDIEIKIEIEKTGNNCRRIQSEIGIEAPLSTVWNLLTDYERLADFIPGLAVCRLLHKTHNSARLFQVRHCPQFATTYICLFWPKKKKLPIYYICQATNIHIYLLPHISIS